MENEFLSRSVLRPGSPVADKYEFIDSCRTSDAKYAYPVKKMCQWLQVSASGFFDWRRRPEPATARRRTQLAGLVENAFRASDETYGAQQRLAGQFRKLSRARGEQLLET